MCDCATKMDDAMKPMNYRLIRNLLEGSAAPALVEIGKIESKKRTPSHSLVATYCPFCGEKYPARNSRGILRA